MKMMDHEVQAYRDSLISWISDASKDVSGCRRRYDWPSYTTNELRDMAEEWQEALEFEMENDRKLREEAVEDFQETVRCMKLAGAKDDATALVWVADTIQFKFLNEMDIEKFLYEHGIAETEYGTYIQNLLEECLDFSLTGK